MPGCRSPAFAPEPPATLLPRVVTKRVSRARDATRVVSWFDTVTVVTEDGRRVLHRRQTLFGPGANLLETIDNRVDALTLAPIRTEARYHGARASYRNYDGAHVSGADPDSNAAGGMRTVDITLPQRVFDFYGGLFDVFLAALPLRDGLTVAIPTDDPTATARSGLTWATIAVTRRDTIAAARGPIPTWRIEANAAGGGARFVFWIADAPPYLTRMWYVGPRGGKQVWDID